MSVAFDKLQIPNKLQYDFKTFSAVTLKLSLKQCPFFQVTYRYYGIKDSFKSWLNKNCWRNRFFDFSETAKKNEKPRQRCKHFTK